MKYKPFSLQINVWQVLIIDEFKTYENLKKLTTYIVQKIG